MPRVERESKRERESHRDCLVRAKPLRMCLSVSHCVSPTLSSSSSLSLNRLKKRVEERECVISCALDDDVYEQWCACINQELLCLLQPLLPTDGNLRRNVEGLSIEAPPLWHHSSPSRPAPALTPSHLSPLALTKQKQMLQSQAACQPGALPAQPAAGGGSLLIRFPPTPSYHAETNLAPRLTLERPDRGEKSREAGARCNIHMKITRLAAM